MNSFLRYLAIVLLVVPFFIPIASIADGYTMVPNVPYVSPSDKTRVGDVYLPTATGLRSAVIYVHGGGWEGGSKEQDSGIVQNLADAGFVVFNINYRLVGHGGEFPEDVSDVKDALCFLATRAKAWSLDPSRIALMGSSAGAHLALLAAYTKADEIPPSHYRANAAKARAVVSWFGPTDLNDLHGDLLDRYLVNSRNGFIEASPVTYVHSAVPTLMVHDTADDLVPFSQSQKLLAALKKQNVPVELHPVNGEGHGFNHGYPAAMDKTVRFLQRHLSQSVNPAPD